MQGLSSWHKIIPYLLLGLIVILLMITVPALQHYIVDCANETSTNLPVWPVYLLPLAVTVIGILAAISINNWLESPPGVSLPKLTEAIRAIGDHQFDNLELPDEIGQAKQITALSEAIRETTDKLKVEFNQLNKEQVMLTTVLSQMTDGVLLATNDGRVELLNKAAENLFKISEAEAVNRSIVEVMRHHALVDLWNQTRKGESSSITFEMGVVHKYLQVIGIPLGDKLPGRSMLLFQDLTITHQLETVRRDFISNISHELRTPMASLKAISETLLDGALEDPPMARKFVLRMDTEVDNLTMMVNELLELSRIEAGRTNFEFIRISPCKLIAKPVERMMLQAERAGLTLSMDCAADLPQVFADPDRLGQVFINLIHNAIKFTPAGGMIDLSAWVHDQDVIFRVRDTGVGISKQDQKRVFERFFKADRSRAGGGTGLGLSICKHMVEAHSGEIWVESNPGPGTSFFFRIPIASATKNS